MGWEEPLDLPSPDLMRSAYWALQPHLSGQALSAQDIHSGKGTQDVTAGMASTRDAPYSHLSQNVDPQQLSGNLGGKVLLPSKRSFLQSAIEAAAKGPGPSKRHERVIQHRDRSTSYTLGGVRCLRTDGKHWRCKREALPEQKYCEKHQHRGHHYGRKRRRKGDEDQQLGAEKIFQGWTKPKQLPWPGLSYPPKINVAPFSPSCSAPWTHHPAVKLPPADESLLVFPPHWTPAQQQILQASLSDLAGAGHFSRVDASYMKGAFPQGIAGVIHMHELQGEGRVPDILRVGPDQLILPPSVRLAPDGTGRFTVRIPTNTLASLGISLKGGNLLSPWDSAGSGAPIYILPGGSSKLVKLEFLQLEGDSVSFGGNWQQPDSAGLSLTLKSEVAEARVESLDSAPRVLSGARVRKGLDLDLNLEPPAVDLDTPAAHLESSSPSSAPSDSPAFESVSKKAPQSVDCKEGALSVRHAGWPLGSRVFQTSPLNRSLLDESHTQGLLRIMRQLEDRKGGSPQTCTGSVLEPLAELKLQRSASLSIVNRMEDPPLQRAVSLPVLCGKSSRPQKTPFKKLEGSNLASVILQTPRGVFLESGRLLDLEKDCKGSSGKASGRRGGVLPPKEEEVSEAEALSDVTDSASSKAEGRKQVREGDCESSFFSKKARFLTEYNANKAAVGVRKSVQKRTDSQGSHPQVGKSTVLGVKVHKGCNQAANPPWWKLPASEVREMQLLPGAALEKRGKISFESQQDSGVQNDSSAHFSRGVVKTEPSEEPLLELRIASPLLCVPSISGSEQSKIELGSAKLERQSSETPSLEEAWLRINKKSFN